MTPLPRYQGVLEEMQVLAQRLLIFGMHVHVGENSAFAVDAMNVVRYMLPTSSHSVPAALSGWDARPASKVIVRLFLKTFPALASPISVAPWPIMITSWDHWCASA